MWILVTAIILGYLVCGFLAARFMLRDWYGQFGDYEGLPWPIVGFFFLLGPLGAAIAFLIYRTNTDTFPRKRRGSHRIADLVRGRSWK